MRADWSPLTAELALWRRENLSLPLWWRDDDAVAATAALDRLATLSDQLGLPVHLAVIPDLVEASLPAYVTAQAGLIPVVHGWRHSNHAPEGDKKAEFGHPRAQAADELARGLSVLRARFGDRTVPLFVPPWNRIAPVHLATLAAAQYGAVSTFGPRISARPAAGLRQINTHIDPVFWRGNRGLVPPDRLIDALVTTLADRRTGHTDRDEPLGLLTHHLVHTDAVWQFSHDVIAALLDGGAQPAAPLLGAQPARSPSI